ncbi:hypothetical protein Q765_14465 [Flavobacterium rivuli WB 3.3-2 = DSM 21788]|uniref:Glycosyl transferase family 1 n=1 Tax=Flavobacterium rivuli WB 3.3-2 = DSM 21788 TaxID=1121895 RepID=A0A0A2MC05_9FLAO|nr:glycosyltransferase family 4 protein [Flavobacterium rivuli]KGO85825.1 hypothetical protein Q765_14465 [Flavobacterium rivuli WB 3.3-2 = DSM 21788]
MKSILVIHQSAELYGSDKTLLLLLGDLDKTKFSILVILPGQGPLVQELENKGIKVVILPVLKLYRKMFTPKNMILFFKELARTIPLLDKLNEKYNFDIVYSNTLAVLLGMFYARKRKIKHIWHVHEIIVHPKIIAGLFTYLLNKYANVVVCNSAATRANLTGRIPAIASKCIVVHNGLDPEAVQHVTGGITRQLLGFNHTDIIVTLVGRISRLKGHKWLLSTYINFLANSNVKLLFVGSPVPGQEYYLHEVEGIIQAANISDKVKTVPFTKELEAVWTITDIAVMPSTEAESFGLVALEAMLAKKPVIAANHGGLTEIVVQNSTGFLVEPGNEQSLADAIKQLTDDAGLRLEMGKKGYERAKESFSQEKYVEGMVSILNTY